MEFLAQHGLEDGELSSESVEALEHDFSDYIVIISLNGRVSDYISKVPFHTAALNWAVPEEADRADQYRQLRGQITELITLIAGEETTQA